MAKENRAKIMMAASMIIFGTIGIFVKRIGISSGELALFRAVMAVAVVGLFLLLTKQPLSLNAIGRSLPLLLISGCAMAFNWILLFEAYRYTTVSAATLSYYFAPVIVTLVSALRFKEKTGKKQWLCFCMATVGIVLITGLGDIQAGSSHLKGIAFGLGAACLYATVMLLNKKITNVDGLSRTFFQFAAAALVLTPYVFFTAGLSLPALDAPGWCCLLAVGLIHSGLAYCLYFSAIKSLPGHKTAILSYIDPFVALVLSVTVLGEPLTPVQLIGGILILGFTLWNELPSKKQ